MQQRVRLFRYLVYMHRIAQTLLELMVPLPLRAAVLASRPSYTLLQKLGPLCGVEAVAVDGEYGRILGSVHDCAILPAYARTGSWSRTNRSFFSSIIGNGPGTYLDIGANIGLTIIPLLQKKAIRCLAFEPEPETFQYLSANIGMNCPQANVELFNVALFDTEGVLELELGDRNKGDHRVHIRHNRRALGETKGTLVAVTARRLDDVLFSRDLAMPLAAKIVAQGSECHILRGGEQTLARAVGLAVEFYPYLMQRTNADAEFLFRFLTVNFAYGTVTPGHSEEQLVLSPVQETISQLRDILQQEATPYQYWHIFVSKAARGPVGCEREAAASQRPRPILASAVSGCAICLPP